MKKSVMNAKKAAAILASCGALVLSLGLFSCYPVAGIFGLGGASRDSILTASKDTSSSLEITISGALPSAYSSWEPKLRRLSAVAGDKLYFLSYTSSSYNSSTYVTEYSWTLNWVPISAAGSLAPSQVAASITTTTDPPLMIHLPATATASGKEELLIVSSCTSSGYGSDTTYTVKLTRVALDGTTTEATIPTASQTHFSGQPVAMDSDASGNLYFLLDGEDSQNPARVVKLDRNLAYLWEFVFIDYNDEMNEGGGSWNYEYCTYYLPLDLSVAPGGKVYVACKGDPDQEDYTPYDGVYVLDGSTGALDAELSRFEAGLFSSPGLLSFDAEGKLYAYSFGRKSLQCHDLELGMLYYATDEAWQYKTDTTTMGDEELLAILPASDGFSVLTLSGTTLRKEAFAAP